MAPVILQKHGCVANITLNRPEVLNCLNQPLLDDLESAVDDVSNDLSIKAIVLSGAGTSFCTGADLKAILALFQSWPDYMRFLHRLTDILRKLENCPVPTIAKIHGYALAGGLELALCCDLIVTSDDARIGDQHSNYGLMAGGGGIPRLIRRVGRQAALEIMYTGRWLSGIEAAERGIALRSVPIEDLDGAIEEIVRSLEQKSRIGLGYLKRAALAGVDVPLETALNEERSALVEYFSSSDHPRRGIEAFLAKGKPNFND